MTINKQAWISAGLRLALLASIAMAPALHAQGPISCSNLTMNGTYMLTATGTVTTPNGPAPITVIGKVTYFGDGTGLSTFTTLSVGGAISKLTSNVPATYTLKSDCTGSKVFGGTQHYDMVVSPNGRLINFIVTDAGVTASGQAVRMDERD